MDSLLEFHYYFERKFGPKSYSENCRITLFEREKMMSEKRVSVAIMGTILCWFTAGAVSLSSGQESGSLLLFDFGQGFDMGIVSTSDAKATLTESGVMR